MLLHPDVDRRVRIVVQLVRQVPDRAAQLDVLVRLVVAGPGAGGDGHALEAAEPVPEQPEVPALGVAAVADAAAEGINMRKDTIQEAVTDFDHYRYESFDGMEEEVDDEVLLGASTLAKLREAAPAEESETVVEETAAELAVDEEE